MPRLGMLTPSSNTVLEPVTAAMLHGHPALSAHFSRFKVTEIALSDTAQDQFAYQPILSAAELLSHARCDVIAWNGTSASWLGFDRDEELVRRIEQATGIRAATCVLGYRSLIRRLGLRRIGLVSPYTTDVQQRIVATWQASDLHIGPETHLGLRDNFSFATITEPQIDTAIRQMIDAGCDGVVILCTNMRGASVAVRLEATLGIPVLDSVAVTLWSALEVLGVDKRSFAPWGRLFSV